MLNSRKLRDRGIRKQKVHEKVHNKIWRSKPNYPNKTLYPDLVVLYDTRSKNEAGLCHQSWAPQETETSH